MVNISGNQLFAICDTLREFMEYEKDRQASVYYNMPKFFDNGRSRNHLLSNLRMYCPNCHSLQKHYRSKNRAGSQG